MKIIRDNWESYLQVLENRHDDVHELEEQVKIIIQSVKEQGDTAALYYTKKWDGIALEQFRVTSDEMEVALKSINPSLKKALEKAAKQIKKFHRIQLREDQFIQEEGVLVGELIRPINKLGIYVPGGKASYPSTVLMNAVPAKLAGVKKIVMVTPPEITGKIRDSVLVAAHIAGVDEIYKVGGAQSIAALTYGTSEIPKVDKIVGPGNIYVALAKKILCNQVGIDMIAGPSEVLILADDTSNPRFIAADLIAQAEHDERAATVVITQSESLIEPILAEIKKMLITHPRKSIVEKSLENYGAIIVTQSKEDMIYLANAIAPEHLEIMVKDPDEMVPYIHAAGAIFIGDYSPEALGDYYAGPNHTLPTGGTARFVSPLSIDDFIKKTSYIRYEKKSLETVSNDIVMIAEDEGLIGHANSIRVRQEVL